MIDAEGESVEFTYEDQLAGLRTVYPSIASDMIAKGWQVVWCTQNKNSEWTPLSGTTGSKSEFPVNRDMPPNARIAFRPPPNVKILDVDHYGEKLGGHTVQRLEEELGELPPTFKVTSRGASSPSGRYLYRVREDLDFNDAALFAFAEDKSLGTCVEIVRTAHRFSWAPGDINPKNGQLVEVFGPDGNPADFPAVSDLPYLPDDIQDYLADPPKIALPQLNPFDTDLPEWWLQIPDNSIGTRDRLASLAFELLLTGLHENNVLIQLKRVAVALDPSRPWYTSDLTGLIDGNTQDKVGRKRAEWAALTELVKEFGADPDEIAARAKREYEQYQLIAASENRTALLATANLPDMLDEEGEIKPESSEEFRMIVVGIHPFDPADTDDMTIARAVLDRLHGVAYCTDSGQWVVYGRERWAELSADLIGWALTELSELMPRGEAKPEEDDPDAKDKKRQFTNRKYVRSAAGQSNIGKVATRVLSLPGQHKLAVRRATLDSDPDVIWAGGKCWDIPASRYTLVERTEEFGDPHLMTAECEPKDMEIPGFWALVNAIFPNPVYRDFWLDLMARGMMGYQSKRTIPLAVGETKSGKTLLLERMPFGTYMSPVSGDDLLGGGDREEARRLSVLVGLRLPYIDEGIRRGKYTMGRLKKITAGGTRLPARRIFGKEFEFKPTHTLVMLVNPEEEPEATDDAVKERLCRVEFGPVGDDVTKEVKADHRAGVKQVAEWYDPDTQIWRDETPGVLAFFIHRAAEIIAADDNRGTSFAKPREVVAKQDEVAQSQDPFAEWLDECCEMKGETDTNTLYKAYCGWHGGHARYRNSPPLAKGAFGTKLTEAGVTKRMSNGKPLRGMTIKTAWRGF